MADISGFGAIARLVASITYPFGIDITEWADDSDPIDCPSIQVGDKAMGGNGDLLTWSKATPIGVALSVIPKGDNDKSLGILLANNIVSRGKLSTRDIITLTINWPDGEIEVYDKGKITDGAPGNSFASAGRAKSKTYQFAFQSMRSA
jgi:hypothetical protein